MKPSIEKTLFDFCSNNDDAEGYCCLAQRSFFEEILDRRKLNSIEELKIKLGTQFEIFYRCMLEYFFSNFYPHPDKKEFWNIIEEIQLIYSFNKADRDFLNALKNSYASLYKVSKLNNTTVSLNSLLEKECLEVKTTDVIKSYIGHTICARPLKLKSIVLTDSSFILPEKIVSSIVNDLLTIHKNMREHFVKMPVAELVRNTNSTNLEDAYTLMKKIWSKDILTDYMDYLLTTASTITASSTIH